MAHLVRERARSGHSAKLHKRAEEKCEEIPEGRQVLRKQRAQKKRDAQAELRKLKAEYGEDYKLSDEGKKLLETPVETSDSDFNSDVVSEDSDFPPVDRSQRLPPIRYKRRKVQRGGGIWDSIKKRARMAGSQALSGFASANGIRARAVKAVAGAIRGATRRSEAQAHAGALANAAMYHLSEPLLGNVGAQVAGVGAANIAENAVGKVESVAKKARHQWGLMNQHESSHHKAVKKHEAEVERIPEHKEFELSQEKKMGDLDSAHKRWYNPKYAHNDAKWVAERRLRHDQRMSASNPLDKLSQEGTPMRTKWSQRRKMAGNFGRFTNALEMVGLGKPPRAHPRSRAIKKQRIPKKDYDW